MRRLIAFGILLYIIISCSDGRKVGKSESDEKPASLSPAKELLPASKLSGKELAVAHCGGCHAFVSPELLPRTVWQNDVLPAMGHRLGIYRGGVRPDSLFDVGVGGSIVRKANIFPASHRHWHL